MLLLRYQQKRNADSEDGGHHGGSAAPHDMRRKINDRDLKSESHRAATRSTLLCIFACGTLLLSLGIGVLCVGLYLPVPRGDPTPWLVAGPTCIVLGVLVLLLSVETILKLRKISSEGAAEDAPPPPSSSKRESHHHLPLNLPVVVHPATPLQPLDVNALPLEVVQHR